jgi:prepilin-type N-terminal cleavage/methylation domain-containing protein
MSLPYSSYRSKTSCPSGFTLIEILVVLALSSLLFGASLAGYVNFNKHQVVLAGGRQVVSDLRDAQNRAANGVLPTGCTTLTEYQLTATAGANSYTVNAICSGPTTIKIKSVSLPTGVTFQSATTLNFYPLNGGVGGNVGTITILSGTIMYQFTVDASGGITEKGLQ